MESASIASLGFSNGVTTKPAGFSGRSFNRFCSSSREKTPAADCSGTGAPTLGSVERDLGTRPPDEIVIFNRLECPSLDLIHPDLPIRDDTGILADQFRH